MGQRVMFFIIVMIVLVMVIFTEVGLYGMLYDCHGSNQAGFIIANFIMIVLCAIMVTSAAETIFAKTERRHKDE